MNADVKSEPIRPRDAALATDISAHIGLSPSHVRQIVGLGEVNHVFVVESAGDRAVVRFPLNPLDTGNYEGEEFGLGAAARQGIPSPEFIGRGVFDGVPYIVQSFVEGIPGSDRPSRELWVTLGRYARKLQAIRLDDAPDALFSRFGRDLQHNWTSHLEYNLGELTAEDALIGLGVYAAEHQPAIRSVFESLREQPVTFGLSHHDIVPKNTLLPPDGRPVLIDWGSASASLAPHTDLLRLLTDHWETGNPTREEIEAFGEGCEVDWVMMLPLLKDIAFLGRIDLVRWAIDRRPDRLEEICAKARVAVRSRLG